MTTIAFHLTVVLVVIALLTSCSTDPEPADARDKQQQQTGPGWFVVSEFDVVYRDSFLVYIDKPEDIQKADQIIAKQIPYENVGARIAAGADGINRNTLGSGGVYHWRVAEFLGFGFQQPEVIDPYLDGSPTRIEADVNSWIDYSSGMVVFPRYTVTARYTPSGNG